VSWRERVAVSRRGSDELRNRRLLRIGFNAFIAERNDEREFGINAPYAKSKYANPSYFFMPN
jgi:hypothetical protein